MKPWKLITTDDPSRTLGEGTILHYPTLEAAADAFVKVGETLFATVIYDDGCVARELTDDEQRLLEHLADMLELDVEDVS